MDISEMDPAEIAELEAMKFVEPIDLATERGDSEIQRFYQDLVLFITGGTGFIGKQLLEKLFRSCDIKKVFLLVRPKKGKSTKERLQEMLRDPVFGAVLKKKPDQASRIVIVEGDAASIRLGISNDDWEKIVNEVEVIFHAAATVRFDETLRTATHTNIRGTRETLALGRACKKLKSFVHISTAYFRATSDWQGKEIQEQFYPSPVPAETLLTLVDTVSPKRLDIITQGFISGWPNTYTFTKAVAEELVQAESGNLPVCVVRPSIVMSTYREPVPGWIDPSGVYGPVGILLGVGLGFVRVFYVNNTLKLSLVPVDYVNNATIAAGWYTGIRGLQEPTIFNISSTGCGVTFSHISRPMRTTCRQYMTPATLWYCYLIETSNRLVYWILSWLLHYIPAYTVDTIMKVFRIKKPKELKSSFVHVSTAYFRATSDWQGKEIQEQFYPSPVPAETLLTLVDTVSPKRLDIITQGFISGWPNTYTFTKAVAEELVQAESGNLPVCVVRPSIVMSTYREPVPGWIDPSGVYGPVGILLGVGLGFVRVFYVNNTLKLSLVPVDYVNNATIAAGWYTGIRGLQEPIIFNISSTGCGVTFSHISRPMRTTCRQYMTPATLWYCYLIETSNRLVYWMLSWLLHYIPAYIVDTIMKVFRIKKPKELKSFLHLYTKFDKLSGVFSHFGTHEWIFDDTNLKQLWQNMSPTDRSIYNFDLTSIDWDHYTIMLCIGMRKYLIKDNLKGTKQAVAKQKWLKLANYTVGILYLYIFWVVLNWFWLIFNIIF